MGTVPACISSHTAIKELILSGNQLDYIPPEMANMSALTDLAVDENGIDCVPDSLGALPVH
jgi:Leucine-rich repeat (LRR) protein